MRLASPTVTDAEGVRRVAPAFVDERGSITDILQNEPVSHVTIVTSKADAVRGNHFHEQTTQYIYVLGGRMRYVSEVPGRERRRVVLIQGDMVVTRPGERHAMRALEDTVFLAMTVGPRGGTDYESDTHRLGPDEVLE